MDYQDSGNVLKLIANLAINGFDIYVGQSEKCEIHPDVNLFGRIDIYELDALVRHAYGIQGGE